jgi:hypothetical protein
LLCCATLKLCDSNIQNVFIFSAGFSNAGKGRYKQYALKSHFEFYLEDGGFKYN